MNRAFPAAPAVRTVRAAAEFSPLQRRDELDGQQVWIWIYRFDASGWWLRAVSSRGASVVWRERFASDALALAAYERTLAEHGGGFIIEAGERVKGMDGFNPDLLLPQDARYTSGRGFLSYTLRTFTLLSKYAGLWPAQSMLGHVITGYLYKGDAPAWPHAVQGIPGAPGNIVMEFTTPPQYIEDHVLQTMGLRKTLAKTGDWWR
ncbi:MAG: hypothetical protein WCK08_16610 [Betaproteobacteria bacterium]